MADIDLTRKRKNYIKCAVNASSIDIEPGEIENATDTYIPLILPEQAILTDVFSEIEVAGFGTITVVAGSSTIGSIDVTATGLTSILSAPLTTGSGMQVKLTSSAAQPDLKMRLTFVYAEPELKQGENTQLL